MRVQTFPRAQILQEFHFQCQALAASNNRGFKQEFEDLSEVGKELTTRAGDSEANREKNRYPFILPYDHCRVRLSVQNSHPHTDYINANFVPGGGSERDFICTQGPLHNTTIDFWRMVWEQNVRIIVMVTSLREKEIVMCEKYWPLEQGTVYHGLIQVTTVSRRQGPDYFITTINLRQKYCATDRIITHYHYPPWPDRGIPRDASSLCAFTDFVRQHLEAIPRLGPTVVHCSAGVGRSGTFITLLWLMQLGARGIKPNVRAAVEDLRLHRMWMVQTLEQYIFVHHCLLQWLCRRTGGTSACPQIQGAATNNNHRHQERPHTSGGDRTGRRRRRHRQEPPPDPPQNTIQQILHPGNLLRRLLPSSTPFNPGSHTP
ncbi:receptor-type tyrosine-protein phosphatase V-like isoform X1 [Echeneis naucrates]|uniref:receptor-type tyrosine-protein phosphatase V-like isoform X1 n=1 Tax=Echeneis naucrates TaxID=173247 RepID=UPI001113C3E5|nr:receptor-type tyrosine-protein phosphatase V-like isoform X1 [Echeneis naucrates]XP_029363255.1 receptor-type tyrosine-protein phosphatase V-like isoform X1 [Echeneis naucrates]XP_029363256.1 receptor-type tyrosine-protein phosphatase V-like isoform X1 [Echeneis naucrates]XP_029363257.1 receptor-type tyrosine-protein phosphatase V-like isoform X1 [Echeneis naucrates]